MPREGRPRSPGMKERFRAVALLSEKEDISCVSVCDSCEETYPMKWIIDNVCPFCGKKHNAKEDPDVQK